MGEFDFGGYVIRIEHGSYIATRNGEIIAEADTEPELLEQLG